MRNPVATPASIILGILLLGFAALVISTYLDTGRTEYVLEQNRPAHIWGTAFLRFLDSFLAFQCAGALIAYSLFLSIPAFFERRALFRYLSSIVVSIVILTVLYVVGEEAIRPAVRRGMAEKQDVGRYSETLYAEGLRKKGLGDPVTALEYLDRSVASDGRNPKKIDARSAIYNNLTPVERDEYLARTTGENRRDRFDFTGALNDARAALDRQDFAKAYAAARLVLAVDPANAEAMRIAGIAGDKTYGASAERERRDERALFERKRAGIAALKAGTAEDLIRAYFIFLDVHWRRPLDRAAADYLTEARQRLAGISFFTAEAELALAFSGPDKRDFVFFNGDKKDERELVSVERLVTVGGDTYFLNVEVAGLGRNGALRYQYLAPYGKLVATVGRRTDGQTRREETGYFITFTGLDRRDPSRRSGLQILSGVPPLDRDRGLALTVPPERLRAYTLTRSDMEKMGIADLAGLLPPFQSPPLFSRFARMDELIIREIVLHVTRPLLLLILTFFCFSIGLTQNARYLSSVPKSIYLWVLIIPFVMIAVMDIVLFLHRMGVVFLCYTLGPVAGAVTVAVLHVFFLALGLLRFSSRIGASLRR